MSANRINVVFYGASVTQQSKADSYWQATCELNRLSSRASEERVFDFARLSFASSRFSDAGVCNYDHLVAMAPNIVVFDWLSTDEQDIDVSILDFMYEDLRSRGIRIVTASFLRADTWERPAPIYRRFLQASIRHNMSFVDMRYKCDENGLGWQDVTRDGVHTNAQGAKLYADAIMSELNRIAVGDAPTRSIHPALSVQDVEALRGQDRPPPRPLSLSTFFVGREMTLRPGQVLTLMAHVPPNSRGRPQIWCKQSIGPFSPVISVRAGSTERINLPDQWCHFTRFAFKPLAIAALEECEGIVSVNISIEDCQPDFDGGEDHDNIRRIVPAERKVRIHDRLIGLDCTILSAKVEG